MEEIKPCPFCGGRGFIQDAVSASDGVTFVMCVKCGATAEEMGLGHKAEAVAAWNRRAERAAERIVESDKEGRSHWFACGQCREPLGPLDSYCPACGTRLADQVAS